jgi:ketosteroid isomerase-like protein
MASDDPGTTVVTELARRFMAGDGAGATAMFAPEISVEQPASLPHGGWHHGLEGMGKMGATFAEYWTRVIENPRIFGDGDQAMQLTTQTWTAKATGRSATVDVVELFRVADGKVTEIRVFQQDVKALLDTLD